MNSQQSVFGIQSFERKLDFCSYLSLLFLGGFVFLSFSLTALSHIFIIVPGIYFTYKEFKQSKSPFKLSQWCILFLVATSIISLLLQSESINPVRNIFKLKYFVIAILSICAYKHLITHYLNPKRVLILTQTFFISTIVSNISGLIGLWTQFNPLKFKKACSLKQACGMYGMTITYGYNVELLALLLISIWLFRHQLKDYLNQNTLLITLIVALISLYLSYSRGALLGFMVAFPLCFIGIKNKAIIYCYAASFLSFLLIVGFMLTGTKSKILYRYAASIHDSSNLERISQYKAVYYAFKENPIWGLGLRNFEPNTVRLKKKYNIEKFQDSVGHAHNNYFEILAGCGLVGFLTFLLFKFSTLKDLFTQNDWKRNAFLPLFIGFSFSGLFQSTIIDGENMFFFMGAYSLYYALRSIDNKGNYPIS